MSYCAKCGNQVAEGGFCSQCGTPVAAAAPPPPPMEAPPPPPMASPPPMGGSAPQYQQPPYNHQYAYAPAQPGFLGDVYSKAFKFLFQKPIRLWALSLLCGLMTVLAVMFGIFPIIWLPIVLVLQLGMANIFLSGFRGMEICATQLFEGFSKKFARNAGGMAWRSLWLFIWALIPIAGWFIVIVKNQAYRFVPYIMLAEPDLKATEALKKSMAMTKGYKGKMFLADFLIGLCVVVASLIFMLIALIPVLGIILTVIFYILLIVLLPLLMGLLEAVYYDKVSKENPVN